MARAPDILCIGSALWDLIGRTPVSLRRGADVPGRILRQPGGVALNIAVTLCRFGLRPALLGAIGRDRDGDELIAACETLGVGCRYVHRPHGLPTDRYIAIEGANGLAAAIADTRTLETAGARILAPLTGGPLGRPDAPWRGPVALDGNLTAALLDRIAQDPCLAAADLRVAPASPGKAERLRPLLRHPGATFYVNRAEAEILAQAPQRDAPAAAAALQGMGAARVLVTDGARAAAMAWSGGLLAATPPRVAVVRVTGAGDTFMAAHIAAELRGAAGTAAFDAALAAAAAHVSLADDADSRPAEPA
jgi:pseudouridine kinase